MSTSLKGPLLGGALLAAGLCVAVSLPGEAAPAQKFQHATGRIVYKLSNQMMNGTSTLTWTGYGSKIRQDMAAKVNANGRSMDLKTWVITDGKNVYAHNPMMGNTVTRMKLSPDMLQKQGPGMPMMAAPKNLGKSLGKATIAGKPCTIHSVPEANNAKMWVWQNLPLKMEMALGQAGGMKMEATKVETGINLPATTFQVPAGMQVKDFQMPAGGMRPGGAAPAPKK